MWRLLYKLGDQSLILDPMVGVEPNSQKLFSDIYTQVHVCVCEHTYTHVHTRAHTQSWVLLMSFIEWLFLYTSFSWLIYSTQHTSLQPKKHFIPLLQSRKQVLKGKINSLLNIIEQIFVGASIWARYDSVAKFLFLFSLFWHWGHTWSLMHTCSASMQPLATTPALMFTLPSL